VLFWVSNHHSELVTVHRDDRAANTSFITVN